MQVALMEIKSGIANHSHLNIEVFGTGHSCCNLIEICSEGTQIPSIPLFLKRERGRKEIYCAVQILQYLIFIEIVF